MKLPKLEKEKKLNYKYICSECGYGIRKKMTECPMGCKAEINIYDIKKGWTSWKKIR